MQRSLQLYATDSIQHAKYLTVLRVLKQWRSQKNLSALIYPEVIDSVLLMLLQKLCKDSQAKSTEEFFISHSCGQVIIKVLEELSQVELFEAVLV